MLRVSEGSSTMPESPLVMPMGFGLAGPMDVALESSSGIPLAGEVVFTSAVVSPVSWVGASNPSSASTGDGFA